MLNYTQTLIKSDDLRIILTQHINSLEAFLILFLLIANSSYFVILILGYINSRRKYAESYSGFIDDETTHAMLEPISMLLPCFNEENSIVGSVQSTLRLNYPEYEVIVINDGSSDNSLNLLIEPENTIR
jgi:cellulose synthase/poly-beta-1,6-N-acetylglucosamine synthase-like glycosyltransferase